MWIINRFYNSLLINKVFQVNVGQELLPSLLHTARCFKIKGLDNVQTPPGLLEHNVRHYQTLSRSVLDHHIYIWCSMFGDYASRVLKQLSPTRMPHPKQSKIRNLAIKWKIYIIFRRHIASFCLTDLLNLPNFENARALSPAIKSWFPSF